jgi:hypothetical protein
LTIDHQDFAGAFFCAAFSASNCFQTPALRNNVRTVTVG